MQRWPRRMGFMDRLRTTGIAAQLECSPANLLMDHAGILLVGDFDALSVLRDILHNVTQRSPIIEDEEGPFLALAYDTRKAIEGRPKSLGLLKRFLEVGIFVSLDNCFLRLAQKHDHSRA